MSFGQIVLECSFDVGVTDEMTHRLSSLVDREIDAITPLETVTVAYWVFDPRTELDQVEQVLGTLTKSGLKLELSVHQLELILYKRVG